MRNRLTLIVLLVFTFISVIHPNSLDEKNIESLLNQAGLFTKDLKVNYTTNNQPLLLNVVNKSLTEPLSFPSYLDSIFSIDLLNDKVIKYCNLIDYDVEDTLEINFEEDDLVRNCEKFVELTKSIDLKLENCFQDFSETELDSFRYTLFNLLGENEAYPSIDVEFPKDYKDPLLKRDKAEELNDLLNVSQISKFEKIALENYFNYSAQFCFLSNRFYNYLLNCNLYEYVGEDFVIFQNENITNIEKYKLIINISGNTNYSFSKKDLFDSKLIIDFAGNDNYIGENTCCSSVFGNFLLFDEKGNDRYSGGDYSIGAAFFGISFIVDKNGRDIYEGGNFSIGSGFFGIGAILDFSGDDIYTGKTYTQGFGYIKGLGVIEDYEGFDLYQVTSKSIDRLRHKDHQVTMAQGMGYGYRPDFSGGIGLIADHSGDDTYISDIFGQACAYWYGLGAIYDKAGNDKYIGYQYSQGAGVHLAAGYLVDLSGNDYYYAWAVSQACGHDLSIGYLLDKKGDDEYYANHLSQGVGHANGIGIFEDIEGKDYFVVKKNKYSRGYGDVRRDFGSIGIFIDYKGKDKYYGVGQDSTWWRNKRYGLGADFE